MPRLNIPEKDLLFTPRVREVAYSGVLFGVNFSSVRVWTLRRLIVRNSCSLENRRLASSSGLTAA